MDLSQKEIIIKSLRIEKPSKLTAYKDSYKSLFPVNKDKKEFLNVASLDDSVESLLIKKYGQKGAFGNSPKLYIKFLRAIEKLGYLEQVASKRAILSNCYTQQSFGCLLDTLQEKEENMLV